MLMGSSAPDHGMLVTCQVCDCLISTIAWLNDHVRTYNKFLEPYLLSTDIYSGRLLQWTQFCNSHITI
jgi:hypothetical protein